MEEPLGRALVFTAKEVRDAFEQTLAAAGASLATWVVLSALSDEGFVSQAVLASNVHLEGATITHHVDRLEALGLVSRSLDADDRRVRRVSLTDAGVAMHARLHTAVAALELETTAGLGEGERAALRAMLATIRGNLRARDGRDALSGETSGSGRAAPSS